MSCDHDVIRLGLGNACGNGAHTNLRHQFHTDIGFGVHVFQVVNELRQVFDGIDIMVGRWRNQAHTRHRITQLTNVFGHFTARQLATFARLGALCHFDLDLIGTDQVFCCDAESTRGHLLDARTQGIAIAQGGVDFDTIAAQNGLEAFALLDGNAFELVAITLGIFATLARVALAPNAIHGHCQSGVRLGRNRTK